MFIGDWMARGARDYPERVAVVDARRAARFTYREMNDRVYRLVHVLRAAGVGSGARVGLLAHNGVEYLDLLFACARLGAIFVPFNWRLHPRELAALAQEIAPAFLVAGPEHEAGAAALLTAAPMPVLRLGGDYDEALAQAPADRVGNEAVREEDLLCLLFTGGTTGAPKGASISYRMVAWNTLTTLVHEVQRGDVTIVHTPMFHTGGLLVYTLPILTVGGTVVLMQRWDADELLSLIERERATLLFCVPTQYEQVVASQRFPTADLRSLRFLTSGGAPLPVALIRQFQAVHPVPFKQGFGMTEFGPGVFSMGPEFATSKAGSIGRPNYFVDARVVDDLGHDVRQDTPGELWLKGPACFSGYYGRPEISAVDPSGWLHTGDLARVDADGFYYIVGRKKDMFISGGENVYPPEIEQALHEHPLVASCAVIGVPDARWGQVGRAFVVLRQGAVVSEDELLDYLRSRLARYKVVKRVVFVNSLPLSAAGKILKHELPHD